jgi:hypothetical protein
MFKLEGIDSIKKQITGIAKSGVRLIAAIQVAAMQVLAHACKHGDVTLAQSLVNSVPKHHKAALVAWLEVYGPFAYDSKTKALKFFKGNKLLKERGITVPGDATVDYMASLPRWETGKKPAEVRSQYDAGEEFDRFMNRMNKLAENGEVTIVNSTLLQRLQATYNRFIAEQVLDEDNISPEHKAGTPEAAEQGRLEKVQFGPVAAVK